MIIVGGLLVLVWVIVSVGLSVWLSPQHLTSLFTHPTLQAKIARISDFLTGDQYITITEDNGFITNKTGIWYSNHGFVIEVPSQQTCEEWFVEHNGEGIALTNTSLCVRSNSKQQVLPWKQLLSGDIDIINTSSGEFAAYTGLNAFTQEGDIRINGLTLQKTEDYLTSLSTSPEFATQVAKFIDIMVVSMLIPTLFFVILATIGATLVLFVGLIIYSLITWAIAGIMKYDITFEHAFSISWLPWLVLKIIGVLLGINWALKSVIWIILIALLIYWYKQQTTTPSDIGE